MPCSHVFHQRHNAVCPLCRYQLPTTDDDEDDDDDDDEEDERRIRTEYTLKQNKECRPEFEAIAKVKIRKIDNQI